MPRGHPASILVAGSRACYRGRMATKKARKKATLNKSDFVRAMPNAGTQDIIAAAKKKGLKISDRYIYAVRSKDKTQGRKVNGPKSKARGRSASRRVAATGLDAQLRRAVAELGLARAREIFGEVEAAFSA